MTHISVSCRYALKNGLRHANYKALELSALCQAYGSSKKKKNWFSEYFNVRREAFGNIFLPIV